MTPTTNRTLATAAILMTTWTAQGVAQSANAKPVKLVTLDLAVPDSPAFTILGLSPETIVRPNAPRDLATTLLNGIDRHGNLQSGLAVDFAPLFLFAGKNLTYERYRDSPATKLIGRTQVSLATAKGTGEGDKSTRLALGIRATLWDQGDPRLDETLLVCLDTIAGTPPDTVITEQKDVDAWVAKATAERRPKVIACQTQSKARRWNASSFAIGVTPAWQSQTGEAGDLELAGGAVWASLALGLNRSASFAASTGAVPVQRPIGQFILQVKYRNGELIPNKTVKGTFFEQDSAAVGARVLLGSSDFAIVSEAEVARQSPAGGDSVSALKLSVGGQIKLSSDLWLSAAVGATRGGAPDEQRSLFVISSMKWALSREPSLKMP